MPAPILPIALAALAFALVSGGKPKRKRTFRDDLIDAIEAATTPEELDSLVVWATNTGNPDLAAAAGAKAAALRAKGAVDTIITTTPPGGGPTTVEGVPPVTVDTSGPGVSVALPGGVNVTLPDIVVGETVITSTEATDPRRYFVVRNGDGGAYQIAGKIIGDSSRWRELRDVQPSAKRRAEISAGKMLPNWRLKMPDNWLPLYKSSRPLETYAEAVAVDGQVSE